MKTTTTDSQQTVHEMVRKGYAAIATSEVSSGSPSCCCGGAKITPQDLAKKIGYSTEELAALPDGANMGLSCGNPAALAALKPGEIVLDLGSGGGFDVFIAGRKVGATGRAIGVDMTPEMLAKARRNTASYRQQTGLDNVEFRLGEIEQLPVADNSVDAIISNCVINLSPDKPQVWREMARVLKPGGRAAVSDLALLRPLPQTVREMVEAVSADPPAPVLYIHGPDFQVVLTNSPGMTSSVPTDQYVIMSRYAHWSRSDNVLVSAGFPASWWIAPRLGAAQITCNEADAIGQFMQADGQVIESFTFPYTISELAEGTHRVTAQHHNDVRSRPVNITAGTTNNFSIEFLYGSALLETEPSGATVWTGDGRYWGVTPLNLPELQTGTWTFLLRHDGYEPATVSLAIALNQKTAYQTNLISVSYTGGMKAAQQYMNAQDYAGALQAVGNALNAKPGDAEALVLQHNATGLGSLQRAKALGNQGDFMGGERELATAIQALPDNAEAPALLAEYKRREPEQIERMRVERLNRGNVVFKNALLPYGGDADLFESHELKTTKPVNDAHTAVLAALKMPPAFPITKDIWPAPETFEIEFVQEFSTFLTTSAGRRVCVIVGAQTKDDETQILFKILEYKTKHNVSMQGLLNFRDDQNSVPIHPSRFPDMTDKLKAQVQEGVTNVLARIQGAIGQTPAEQPAAPK